MGGLEKDFLGEDALSNKFDIKFDEDITKKIEELAESTKPILKIKNSSKHKNPHYAKDGDSGMDLRANIDSPIILKPLERRLISTGIFIELPFGYEAQIRTRSGMALKKGLSVLNTPGTIDLKYRGEIQIIAVNLSNNNITIEDGDRIAQMVISPVLTNQTIRIEMVDELTETERGNNGFGSSGEK